MCKKIKTDHDKLMKRYWPEIMLIVTIILSIVFAIYSHHLLGLSGFTCMCFENIDSEWDLFWMSGIPYQNIQSEWWHGLGHTLKILMILPLLAYAVIRGTKLIKKHNK
ncbi:MAG: hypothetical protein PF692_02125 [Kiritimatiellae bacterium]|nr:hypothetical protein [Kiritimatiellia bacterium]